MRKNIIIGVLAGLLCTISFFWLRNHQSRDQHTVLANLEEIRKLREFHVVSFRYVDLFFYHNKLDKGKKVVAVATVPVSLKAYFDMSHASFENNDSNLIILLPPPSLTEPVYHFDEIETRSVRRFSVVAGIDIHKRMLEGLRDKVKEQGEYFRVHARRNGIDRMAESQASSYFDGIFTGLGFSQVTLQFQRDTSENILAEIDSSLMIGLEGIQTNQVY